MSWHVEHSDSLDYLRTLEPASVDLVLTDPPYFRVKAAAWDRQWSSVEAYLAWLGEHAQEWQRVLKPNGSLYCFVWPALSADVEILFRQWFNVLTNIRWEKPRSMADRSEKAALRSFFPASETILFAEQYGADSAALGISNYTGACEALHGSVFEPLRAYLDGERKRAGVSRAECNAACGFSPTPGAMASRHYFSVSQWCLPTVEHYKALQSCFNRLSPGEYLQREYEDLRQEYEDLRQEYENLRQEYENLRRPFFAESTRPYTDVWTYKTKPSSPVRHICEKPLAMLRDIILTSSRNGAVVLDSFVGSGSTGVAAVCLGRSFLGSEQDKIWVDRAQNWIDAENRQGQLFAA